jgi:hypothetical protein
MVEAENESILVGMVHLLSAICFCISSYVHQQLHSLDCQHFVHYISLVPEIIDPVFAKTSPKRSFSITEYERFGLVFTKTRVYKFGHSTFYLSQDTIWVQGFIFEEDLQVSKLFKMTICKGMCTLKCTEKRLITFTPLYFLP